MPANSQETPQKILAIRLDNIGDVIMVGPALRAIRTQFPSAEIHLLASPAGSQAAALLPWVDRVIPWRAVWQDISPHPQISEEKEWQLIEMLRRETYDVAFIFTSFAQSPYPPATICALAGIPNRVAISKEFGGGILSHWVKIDRDELHQVDRNLEVVRAWGIQPQGTQMGLEIPPEAIDSVQALLAAEDIDVTAPWMVVAPGASCSARRYPIPRFVEATRLLMDRVGIPVVLSGSSRESAILQPFADIVDRGRIVSLIGKTVFPQFAALIQLSSFVLANNSAALHAADALQKPMAILYSGTELRSQWEPRHSPALIFNKEVACSPCYRFECPYHMECLDFRPVELAEMVADFLMQEIAER